MTFKAIALKNGKSIASVPQAQGFISQQVSNSQRSTPLWDSAISAIKNAVVDSAWESKAREAMYKALVSDRLAN
jgi:hypothetical protein